MVSRQDDLRETLFAEAWIANHGNGVDAARRAGYRGGRKSLGVQAVRLLARARVQEKIRERLKKAIVAVQTTGGKVITPERVLEILSAQAEGGEFFEVDEATGEPIIDLKKLKAAGKLHLVRKVQRKRMVRTYTYENGSHVEEETRNHGVELYSAQSAAEILGRYFGLEKRAPETPVPPMLAERTFVLAILESGDPRARAALEAVARKVLPGTGPVVDVEVKRG